MSIWRKLPLGHDTTSLSTLRLATSVSGSRSTPARPNTAWPAFTEKRGRRGPSGLPFRSLTANTSSVPERTIQPPALSFNMNDVRCSSAPAEVMAETSIAIFQTAVTKRR